ncbi:FCD domain-containing protein [Xanthobacter sp. YC-JY1]|nr:FCD domain-containing protein [Xanthobacter sp. YC-JY1]
MPRGSRPLADLTDTIEALIAERGLQPGARLPAERALAAELNVSRPTLREAIRHLASRGRLVSRRGGGTYVAAPADAPLAQALGPLAAEAAGEPGYWHDVMEIRKSLDADMAFHAALRAGPQDKANLQAALENVISAGATDAATQAKADSAFHMAVAEASHNAVMRQVMAGLFDLLRHSISRSLEKLYLIASTAQALDDQHRAIAAAIIAGRPEEARKAALLHLEFVEETLREIEDDAARRRRSSRVALRQQEKELTP